MQAGRPTKYSAEMNDRVIEYLEQCQDEYSEFHKTRGEKSDSYDRLVTVKLPTIEGLAIFLGVAVSTVHLWSNEHEVFSESLELIKQEQKNRLLSKGLSGDYNATIAKLILSSNHGMAEKTETDVNLVTADKVIAEIEKARNG